MALYDRLMGLQKPKIQVHTFMSFLQEWMLGNVTGAQAAAAVGGLDASETTDATAIRDRILQETNANAVTQSVLRRLKGLEIEQVLICGEAGAAPYDTPSAVQARVLA